MNRKFLVPLDYAAADGLVLAILQETVTVYLNEKSAHLDDQEYAEQFVTAANLVIEHFGVEPVTAKKRKKR